MITDEAIIAYRDEDGCPILDVALCNWALGIEADDSTDLLQEREWRWFLSLTPAEARAEVGTRIAATRAREIAQEQADDEANRRAGEAHADAMLRHSHYPDGDPEDRWR